MSATLQKVYSLLQVERTCISPYHSQTDRLVKRFNAMLKLMLKKFVNKKGKAWDEYLPYQLFAYREAPKSQQASPHLNCCLDGGYVDLLTFSRKHGQPRQVEDPHRDAHARDVEVAPGHG